MADISDQFVKKKKKNYRNIFAGGNIESTQVKPSSIIIWVTFHLGTQHSITRRHKILSLGDTKFYHSETQNSIIQSGTQHWQYLRG